MPTNLLTVVGGPPTFYDHPDRGCANTDTAVFFPTDGMASVEAQAICEPCPFKVACLKFALDNGVDGVWGGTGQNERARMRRATGRSRSTQGPTDDRRQQVAEMTAGGWSAAAIAAELRITRRSVERLRRSLRNDVAAAA